MFLGVLILGPLADVVGRHKVLFPSMSVVLVVSLLSAFFLKSLAIFAVLRILVGFASGKGRVDASTSITLVLFVGFLSLSIYNH